MKKNSKNPTLDHDRAKKFAEMVIESGPGDIDAYNLCQCYLKELNDIKELRAERDLWKTIAEKLAEDMVNMDGIKNDC